MKINIMYIEFPELHFNHSQIPKLRGFFSNKFPDNIEFHNHLPSGKFSYKFPKIQYRIINNHPVLIGINEGIDILKKVFFSLDEIIISKRKYVLHEKEILLLEREFGISDDFISYHFISPWMALNKENHTKYIPFNKSEQQQFLKRILIGNIISMAKGLNYTVPDDFVIKIKGYFKPKKVNYKNQKMLCFSGEFITNFHIPDFMGLGKQSARGFGVVEKI
ncbi:MAG: CRISPR-associated endonuclease Cas6 [FCB group bacterium]|nr:CRISPR-associated endonuclease Cas6 [FCB group bacterium]